MTLPDFIVIGAMKAGTTALWRYLRAHSEVFMANPKEVQFFSRNWDEGWEWYEARFADGGAASAVGEASPSYADVHFSEVPERIASRLPDIRLIYLVRNPVDRVASQYLHSLARGLEDKSIEDAVHSDGSYLGINEYATVIERYLEHFSRSQLLVLQSESLRDDREPTLSRILEFIGVDPRERHRDMTREHYRADQKPGDLKLAAVRARTTPLLRRTTSLGARVSPRWLERRYLSLSTMPPGLRDEIAEAARPQIQRLRAYLDPSFDGWGIG